LPSAGLNTAPAARKDAAVRSGGGSPPPPMKHKRFIRNYLLDRSLQLRYVLFVTVLSAGLCALFGYFIWQQKDVASQTIIDGINRADWIDPAMKGEIGRTLRDSDLGIVYKMVAFGCTLILVLTMFLIVMTHKVAGPLHKIASYFEKIKAGKLPVLTDLRRGDQFQDFFEKFKEMDETLRRRATEECRTYDRFLRACEGQSELSVELRQRLDETAQALKEKEESLV
jgi:methyl-accepting chemotaxis protein